MYISLNTKYRAKSKNDFEKNKYESLHNSVFGKTIQNNRKQGDIQKQGIDFLISDFRRIFSLKEKNKVKMNSPIFVGESVLDLSKILIYEFNHDHIIPNGVKKC